MGYSDAEIKVFEEKEKRIVRQSCLKVAVVLVSERPNFRDNKELDSLALVKEMAGELVEWVYEVAKGHPDEYDKAREIEQQVTQNKQLPEPTLAQKKVLDKIAGKLDMVQVDPSLKTKVLDWAEKTHGSRSYPTKVSSVDEFIKWYTN